MSRLLVTRLPIEMEEVVNAETYNRLVRILEINLGEFELSFISTIFGSMSAKVNTLVDFFFVGSSKKNEQINKK